ncbi:MAG: hypothetical protein ABSA90_12510 [Xanthobacteraceae bacterium]|jgi:hypothetical protein
MAELEDLQAENIRLRSMLSLAGVAMPPPADLPSSEDLDELFALVKGSYPKLEGDRFQFGRAMIYLCYARRATEPNEKYAATYWLDACREWLGKQAYPRDVSLRSFTAAVIASAIPVAPLTRFPYDLAFGLTVGDARQPSAAWRDVLRAGAVPKPMALKRPAIPPRTQQLNLMHRADDRPGVVMR